MKMSVLQQPCVAVCLCAVLLWVGMLAGLAQTQSSQPEAPKAGETSSPKSENGEAARHEAETPTEKAWHLLKAGLADHNVDKRATAVRVLGLLPNNQEAARLAEHALADEKPEVRAAAATALGQMRARKSIRLLRKALNDNDTSVVLAAASSLRIMGDRAAYRVYYAVLTGERKSGGGLLAGQEKMLKDPKKMAVFGFEQGIGQIPFAGIGFQAIKALRKDDTSPVRAAAAKALAKDPDPRSGKALVTAASDGSWIVRAAALDAIAHRGDPALLPTAIEGMSDDKDAVRFTAAATVLHLSSARAPASKKVKK
jgi:HEAT repeat protein